MIKSYTEETKISDNNEKCVVYETDLEKYQAIEANLLQAVKIYINELKYLDSIKEDKHRKVKEQIIKTSRFLIEQFDMIKIFLETENI